MKEKLQKVPVNMIEKVLNLPKVDSILYLQYLVDQEYEGFDPNTTQAGFIITVESNDLVLDGTLSRQYNVLAVLTSYSKIKTIIENPKVLKVELLNEDLVDILRLNPFEEIELKCPWSGPVGDEWDSPAYNAFWNPVEQDFNKKIKTLERVGKKVKIK